MDEILSLTIFEGCHENYSVEGSKCTEKDGLEFDLCLKSMLGCKQNWSGLLVWGIVSILCCGFILEMRKAIKIGKFSNGCLLHCNFF